MRPDELAAQTEIERSKERDKLAKKGIAAGAGLVGAGLSSRILPLLNEYVPFETAMKGINKINPKLGEMLKNGQSMGLNIKEGFNYIKDHLQPFSKEEPEQTKQSNPLQDFETNYPELARGLMVTIQQGQKPEAAAAILKQSSGLGKMVKKLEKETGKNFIDYVLELFGPQQQMQGQQQNVQPQGQQMQQPGQQAQHGGQDQSGLDQQIMMALDKILKM